MKKYIFCFWYLLVFVQNPSFGGVITNYELVTFNKYDIFHYWALQQLIKRYGGHDFLAKKCAIH